ncbi:MAG: hydantoinase/oxoprolinase family protein [Gammaproteobacteria bacterium]
MQIVGWDIGGAHVKRVIAEADGRLTAVDQVPCPLWLGADRLAQTLDALRAGLAQDAEHRLTMTGELADVFESRADGVRAIVGTFGAAFGRARIFAGRDGFVSADRAPALAESVASANWLATARFLSRRMSEAVLVDIGSTTTDIVALRDGAPGPGGYTDAERLATGELVYTGVVRTPVACVVEALAFSGERVAVMAEVFATMADVYTLTGELVPDQRFGAAADGRGRAVPQCARRLARMIGRDAADADPAPWRRLAGTIARLHRDRLRVGLERRLSALPAEHDPTLVGAGVGRFVVRALAADLGLPYRDLAELWTAPAPLAAAAADCAPAASLTQAW